MNKSVTGKAGALPVRYFKPKPTRFLTNLSGSSGSRVGLRYIYCLRRCYILMPHIELHTPIHGEEDREIVPTLCGMPFLFLRHLNPLYERA